MFLLSWHVACSTCSTCAYVVEDRVVVRVSVVTVHSIEALGELHKGHSTALLRIRQEADALRLTNNNKKGVRLFRVRNTTLSRMQEKVRTTV